MNQRKQTGFSLLEALITLAILGIGLAGTAKLQSLVFARMLDARARNEALQFTMKEIERTRFQTRYDSADLTMPIRATLTGTHSRYDLKAEETTTATGHVRQLDFTTRWHTPGTDGTLSINTLFTEQPYSTYLYRLGY